MIRINLKSFLSLMAVGLMCLSALSANAQSDYSISMPDVSGQSGGTVTVPVNLTNSGGVLSMQVDVVLPDGVDIVNVERSERIANAEFFQFGVEDHYNSDNERYRRIIVSNLESYMVSAITGNEGPMYYITFQLPEEEGVYPIQLKNIQYFNPPTYAIEYIADVTANITVQGNTYVSMPEFVEAKSGQNVTIPVSLNNDGDIHSLQVEVFLPDGVDLVTVEGTERIANADFFNFAQNDQYTEGDSLRYRRILLGQIYNYTTSAISGNEGVIYNITFSIPEDAEESYPIVLKNIQYFCYPTYEVHFLPDVTSTIIVTEPEIIRGDVNGNGFVNMDDLTRLINYLVFEGITINVANSASCNNVEDTTIVNMDDLTALINYLVFNHWSN